MYLKTLASTAIFLATWPTMAVAGDLMLAPSSKWAMNYAPDSCELTRAFGAGDDTLVVQFIRYEPSTGFDFNLMGRPLGRLVNHPFVKVKFGATGEAVGKSRMAGTIGRFPALFLSGRLDNLDFQKLDYADLAKLSPAEQRRRTHIDPATEAAVTTATIQLPGRSITIALGSMGPPMAALRKCTTDLVSAWGLDPSQQDALSIPAKPKSDPSKWFLEKDYPPESLRKFHQAIIRFRLMVDAAGQITACSVPSAISKDDFAELTCRLLKLRAQFDPAQAANGTAVPSYYVGGVKWIIP